MDVDATGTGAVTSNGKKTYSHLEGNKRVPSEYEIKSSHLLHHVGRGLEVNVPSAAWIERYQTKSPLTCTDWERFADPAETTYAKYVDTQRAREAHVDGIFRSIDESGYDAALTPTWIARLDGAMSPLRFAFHGLQMIAAYVGCMAPSGRVTIALLFQSANEMRRIQRIAYRMAQLRRIVPEIGSSSKAAWEKDATWQPLRRVIERLMVTYDFGEALVGLDFVLAPMLDDLVMTSLPALAMKHGDPLLGQIAFSLQEDCRFTRAWTIALSRMLIDDRSDNRDVLRRWIDAWRPPAREAIASLAAMLTDGDDAAIAATRTTAERHDAFLRDAGLAPS